MNNEAMKEVLNDLFSHMERLETQTEAILQLLKEKKRVTDKQLARSAGENRTSAVARAPGRRNQARQTA